MSLLQLILTRELLSEPMSTHISQTMNQTHVSSNKTIGNISNTTVQFIISNENSLEPKQNKAHLKTYWMVTEVMENYSGNEEVGQSPLVLAKAPAVIENNQDYHRRKF